MTPQERQLVAELFERLASLEGAPRDPDAERTIRDGLRQAPNAAYALVQTCLVQDEALKQANARIEELEAYMAQAPGAPQGERGFLDGMRDALFGRRDEMRGGSVPSVPQGSPWSDAAGRGGAPMGVPPGYRPDGGGPHQGAPMGGQMPQEASRGGSFLGTAAATVAGVVGGALLMNGIRSMLGGGGGAQHGPFAGAFDEIARGGDGGGRDPWGGGSGNLARDAGLDDIGRGGRGSGDADGGRFAGLFGSSDQSAEDDDAADDDGYDDAGDDGDTSEA